MSTITYAGQPCLEPVEIRAACVKANLPIDWFGLPNTWTNRRGCGSGLGYVLLARRSLLAITPNTPHDLTFFLGRQEVTGISLAQPATVTHKNLHMVGSNCISPGMRQDDNATYLVELADWRRLARAGVLDQAFNVIIPGGTAFYKATLDGSGSPWTLHVVGLYWITEAILFEAGRFWWLVPLAVPALAGTLAVFIAAACFAARFARPGWPRVLALAGGWVLADLARQFVLTGFPWNPWGSVWEIPGRVGDAFIQPAAWVGVHGLTLVTLILAALPVLGWQWRIGGVVVLAAWGVFGLARSQQPVPPRALTVVLVQGNIAQGEKFSQELASRIFQHYLDLTSQSRTAQASVWIWPETSFPGLLDVDAAARQVIEQVNSGAPSLIGSVRFDQQGRPRNSLFAVLAGSEIAGVYDKWHLVPFGEYVPNWLPLPIAVMPGDGFTPGPGPRTLHVPGLPPFGALICYEAIFSGEIVERTDRPEWLVNVTNDAWFGNSTGPRQHLAAARMRAVEEGLPLLRAANTGISAAFDAHGHELARIDMQTSGVLAVTLPGALPRTLFGRFGLIIPAISGLVALGGGLMARRVASLG